MISNRKIEHVKIIANENVQHDHNYWNDIEVVQQSIPEVDYDDIDISVDFSGIHLKAPIIISSMTGGHPETKKINENLAIAAAEKGIGMGVGSERAAIENPELGDTFSVISNYDVPLRIANVGAPQLIDQKKPALTEEQIQYAVDLIKANLLAIHFNFVQEMIQPEGDRKGKGILDRLSALTKKFKIIAKETGAGFSKIDIINLKRAGVVAIDVGGRSGTSFSAVETYRNKSKSNIETSALFWNWGIPSPISVRYSSGLLPTIASGGIRSGVDVFKGLMVGASLSGSASPFLKAALVSDREVVKVIDQFEQQLKIIMLLTGCKKVEDIRNVRYIITGRLSEWWTQY